MSIRVAIVILAAAALAACAAAETHQIARASWEDSPDVRKVIENELDIVANTKCARGYDVLSRESGVEDGRHVTRWTIACAR